jgi:hypothetical protein
MGVYGAGMGCFCIMVVFCTECGAGMSCFMQY